MLHLRNFLVCVSEFVREFFFLVNNSFHFCFSPDSVCPSCGELVLDCLSPVPVLGIQTTEKITYYPRKSVSSLTSLASYLELPGTDDDEHSSIQNEFSLVEEPKKEDWL